MNRGGSRGAAPGAPPPKIGKNMIFWHKIVIFHTKYPQNFRAFPPLGAIFLSAPPPPPPPLTLNTGSAPDELVLLVCFSTVDNMNLLIWSNPIHYKKSMQFHIFIIELQYQYLNYIPGIPVLTILEQIFILVIAKYRRSRYSTLLVTKFIHKTSRHSQCSDFSTTCKMNVLVLSSI